MISQRQILLREVDTEKVAQALGTARVFTPAELADHLGKVIQTLHNWRKAGLLEDPVRVGNYTFWTLEQVERLQKKLETRNRDNG